MWVPTPRFGKGGRGGGGVVWGGAVGLGVPMARKESEKALRKD